MTNECAKFLLSTYRPNGSDAQDPYFKEALEQALRDPVLASWFQEQRDIDEMISAKLLSIVSPAGLEATILAGLRTTSLPRYSVIRWLVVAAALILGVCQMTVPPRSSRRINEH